ncbi:hypothetical protein CCACVL1_19820 [Corchorus capsularis]|uniref:Uncharacterized protein n=1 Tax=Corchorus capsularis TaxID=210143 RepID=A0A1R3HEL5_COCAP|nr:hypothetical protein CCACVL1_19820 [Corchorus capsularis]
MAFVRPLEVDPSTLHFIFQQHYTFGDDE